MAKAAKILVLPALLILKQLIVQLDISGFKGTVFRYALQLKPLNIPVYRLPQF